MSARGHCPEPGLACAGTAGGRKGGGTGAIIKLGVVEGGIMGQGKDNNVGPLTGDADACIVICASLILDSVVELTYTPTV